MINKTLVKKAMIEYKQKPIYDNIKTPYTAVMPLLSYLPKENAIWECTDPGDSKISEVLKKKGYEIISTDILTGFDFLKDKPDFEFDMIVTNPPYSMKNPFLKKAYEYNKPFAFLMPLTTLEGVERNALFRKYGISLIVLSKRINFEMKNSSEKSHSWFPTGWFIWKLTDRNKLFFED